MRFLSISLVAALAFVLTGATGGNKFRLLNHMACQVYTVPGGNLFSGPATMVTGWSVSNGTRTTSTTIPNPACASTTSVFTEDSSTNGRSLNQTVTGSFGASVYTLSALYKRVTGTRNGYIIIFDLPDFKSEALVGVDLGTCSINVAANIVYGSGVGATFLSPSGWASKFGQWCQLTLRVTGFVTASMVALYGPLSGTTQSYTGNGTSSIAVYGAWFQ